MDVFDRGMTRTEILRRGAAGAAAIGGADVLLRAADAGAGLDPKPGGKLVVGIGQVFEDINVLTAFGYRWGQLMGV